MPYYRTVGQIPRKRHTQFRRPDGGLYAEELMGVEGFSNDSSLLYHRGLPTAILEAKAIDPPVAPLTPNHPLKPRHFLTHKLDAGSADAVTGRQVLMANGDVRMSYVAADTDQPAVPQRGRRRVRVRRVGVRRGRHGVRSAVGRVR